MNSNALSLVDVSPVKVSAVHPSTNVAVNDPYGSYLTSKAKRLRALELAAKMFKQIKFA